MPSRMKAPRLIPARTKHKISISVVAPVEVIDFIDDLAYAERITRSEKMRTLLIEAVTRLGYVEEAA